MQQIIFYLVLMEKELHPKIIVRGWVVSSIVLLFVISVFVPKLWNMKLNSIPCMMASANHQSSFLQND